AEVDSRSFGGPWRHLLRKNRLADRLCPGTCVAVAQQRHRRSFSRTVANLAPRLKNRFDVLVKRDFRLGGASQIWQRGERQRKSNSCDPHGNRIAKGSGRKIKV